MLSFLKLPLADKKSVLLSIVDTIKDRAFARQLQRAALSFNGR
jgi:hypothetical protein